MLYDDIWAAELWSTLLTQTGVTESNEDLRLYFCNNLIFAFLIDDGIIASQKAIDPSLPNFAAMVLIWEL
jgi:hypothetical protein